MMAGAAINVKDYGATGDGTTDDYAAILLAEAATPNGGSMYWPDGVYNIGSNVWTLADKIINHYSQAPYLTQAVKIIGSGSQTIQTNTSTGSGPSRGTSFEGFVILNSNTNGVCITIRNGGIGLTNVTAECSGSNGEGILITQMWVMTWKDVFASGKSSGCRLYCDGTDGSIAINVNVFIGLHCSGQNAAASNGLFIKDNTVSNTTIKGNTFIGFDVAQCDRGVHNGSNNNTWICPNIESNVTGWEEEVTSESVVITPTISLGLVNTWSPLTELTPRRIAGLDVEPRQFAGATPGLKFANPQVPSTDVKTLDDYEEYNAPSTACEAALTVAVAWNAIKIGRVVTVKLPATVGTATAATSFQFGHDLPTKFRPTENMSFSVPIRDNGAGRAAPGVLHITTTGLMSVYFDGVYTGLYTAAAVAGLAYGACVSFTVTD